LLGRHPAHPRTRRVRAVVLCVRWWGGKKRKGMEATVTPTVVTKLAGSGLRVASIPTGKAHCCLGIFLPVGSRYETPRNTGITRALELALLAAASNSAAPAAATTKRWPVRVSASRDCLALAVEALVADADAACAALTDVLFRAPLSLQHALSRMPRHPRDMPMSVPEVTVQELLHEAAYSGADTPIGRRSPRCVSAAALARLNQARLDDFVRYVRATAVHNGVFAAAGMEHSHLLRLARTFLHTARTAASMGSQQQQQEDSKGRFVGGKRILEAETLQPRLFGPTAHLAHLGIAFPSHGLLCNNGEIYAPMVAATVLGGGSSFSQGGPGKGMHSRLYRGLLCEPWVEAAVSFHAPYRETGLLGITGACEPRQAGTLLAGMAAELLALAAAPVPATELDRAKAMLCSSLSMAVEQTSVLCDDIGRQLLLRGKHETGQALSSRIMAVTAEDVRRVVANGIQHQHRPAVAGIVPRAHLKSLLPSLDLHNRLKTLLNTFHK